MMDEMTIGQTVHVLPEATEWEVGGQLIRVTGGVHVRVSDVVAGAERVTADSWRLVVEAKSFRWEWTAERGRVIGVLEAIEAEQIEIANKEQRQ